MHTLTALRALSQVPCQHTASCRLHQRQQVHGVPASCVTITAPGPNLAALSQPRQTSAQKGSWQAALQEPQQHSVQSSSTQRLQSCQKIPCTCCVAGLQLLHGLTYVSELCTLSNPEQKGAKESTSEWSYLLRNLAAPNLKLAAAHSACCICQSGLARHCYRLHWSLSQKFAGRGTR